MTLKKIQGNTNGRWGNMPTYQQKLLIRIKEAIKGGKLKTMFVKVNAKRVQYYAQKK